MTAASTVVAIGSIRATPLLTRGSEGNAGNLERHRLSAR